MILASAQAAEIRLKKSRIAKKGLKLNIEVSWSFTELECAILDLLKGFP